MKPRASYSNEQIACMYRSGDMEMQQIADLVGVTRARIQQITSKFGLTRLDGVRAKRTEVAKRHAGSHVLFVQPVADDLRLGFGSDQ